QSPAAERRLRVTGQHRHGLSGGANDFEESADEAALADAGTAGDGNHVRGMGRRAQSGEDVCRVLPAGQQTEEPAQSEAVAMVEAIQERLKHRTAPPASCSA